MNGHSGASHTQSKADTDDEDDDDIDLDDIDVDSPVDGATRLSDDRPESRSSPEPSPGLSSISSPSSSPDSPPPLTSSAANAGTTVTSSAAANGMLASHMEHGLARMPALFSPHMHAGLMPHPALALPHPGFPHPHHYLPHPLSSSISPSHWSSQGTPVFLLTGLLHHQSSSSNETATISWSAIKWTNCIYFVSDTCNITLYACINVGQWCICS